MQFESHKKAEEGRRKMNQHEKTEKKNAKHKWGERAIGLKKYRRASRRSLKL